MIRYEVFGEQTTGLASFLRLCGVVISQVAITVAEMKRKAVTLCLFVATARCDRGPPDWAALTGDIRMSDSAVPKKLVRMRWLSMSGASADYSFSLADFEKNNKGGTFNCVAFWSLSAVVRRQIWKD